MRLKQFFLTGFCILSVLGLMAQVPRWQQRVAYHMDIDMDVTSNQYSGTQRLTYINNSPDTLTKVFYHLYFNAFQPNSMMDVHSRNILDPDRRVEDRIQKLSEKEIGYLHVISLTNGDQSLDYESVGTILEVSLNEPIHPGDSTIFNMEFEGQVPLQIRRSGRDNAEGVRYTMTQWYPKMCEYDLDGWHANPYISREFHGVWGDFDVTIHIDPTYVVAASGVLQDAGKIGYGYAEKTVSDSLAPKEKLSWNFIANNVHDFAWAADPDYTHEIVQVPDGPTVHFFFQAEADSITEHWQKLQPHTVELFQIMNETFGKYPYPTYSVIQGGDGGMEYAMCTMITGFRPYRSLLGVTVHEVIHSWFQHVLATNESLYAWMDEGFTSYASSYVINKILDQNALNPHEGSYRGYFSLVESRLEEPSSTHADHFYTNFAYGRSAYSKGAVFLHQLSYIIGNDAFFQGMKRYYNSWKFRHPEPRDLKRIMEKESGLELDWYFEYWINSAKFIDYGIDSVYQQKDQTTILLRKKGLMPMPIDLMITYEDGQKEYIYIPMRIMRGEKEDSFYSLDPQIQEDWPWTHLEYPLSINRPMEEIKSIVIDPTLRMADINMDDNRYSTAEEAESEPGDTPNR